MWTIRSGACASVYYINETAKLTDRAPKHDYESYMGL
jgi:hypothetical protein